MEHGRGKNKRAEFVDDDHQQEAQICKWDPAWEKNKLCKVCIYSQHEAQALVGFVYERWQREEQAWWDLYMKDGRGKEQAMQVL